MLSHTLTFSPDADDSIFKDLPATPAVFLLRGTPSTLHLTSQDASASVYVSKTANLRRRLERLLGRPTELTKRLNLRDRVNEIEFTLAGSDFESQFLLYKTLREVFPKTYSARLRIRPAPLIKLHLGNEYPRASVTTRLGKLGAGNTAPANLYYGPFLSRVAAEKFASDALDFFKMRRCVDDLHPDPAFPGCVYSEMKMCLAPCFKGCTDSEYHAEVARVQNFLESRGGSLSCELAEQRDRASAELAFEEAAAIHAKIDKLKPLLSQLPDIVQRIDQLRAVIIQPSAESGAVSAFLFQSGILNGPVPFSVELRAESQSMESRVEQMITSFQNERRISAAECTEQLALLKRWYYRSQRIGEIFFAGEKGTWPLRRIVRGIGRVHRGEKPSETAAFSATAPVLPTSEQA